MDRMDLYERARRVNETLEGLALQDLNPTFGELRHILRVMQVGWGKGPQDIEGSIKTVEELLERKGIALKA